MNKIESNAYDMTLRDLESAKVVDPTDLASSGPTSFYTFSGRTKSKKFGPSKYEVLPNPGRVGLL